jgi:branched-subunit amino acid ABC-type transport system permease component
VISEVAVQTVANVFMLSAIYILVALGFALLINVLGILNFAHAAIYMAGGYISYELIVGAGINQWVSLLISAVAIGALGLLIERVLFRPFLALIIIIEATVNVTIGSYVRRIPSFVPGVLRIGTVSLSGDRLATFVVGSCLLAAAILFIRKTKTGTQMLAVSQDFDAAALQGINTRRIFALTTAIGCALAAVAGSLMGAVLSLSPLMGDYMLVKAIEIVILAGIGSIGGVLIGGLILGLLDASLPLFIGGSATDLIGLSMVIILLLFRPQGLFGHEA